MKYFITILLALVINVQAKEYNIKIKKFDEKKVTQTLDELMNDLKYFMEKPLHWCKVVPTGEFAMVEQGIKTSKIRMEFQTKCDERTARKKLKNIMLKYDKFLMDHSERIEYAIECMYPDYQLSWGYKMNGYPFLKISLKQVYGGTGNYSNKTLFFRLNINDDYLTKPLRFNLRGSTLTSIITNTIPTRFREVSWFVFDIPTELLKDDDFNVEIERQWHLVFDEKFIKINDLY